VLLWWQGGDAAATYYSAYLIEKALSVDNVFIFALIFGYFAVPERYQHRVLFWGVIGALLMRLVFIFVGSGLLQAFFWTAYLFRRVPHLHRLAHGLPPRPAEGPRQQPHGAADAPLHAS